MAASLFLERRQEHSMRLKDLIIVSWRTVHFWSPHTQRISEQLLTLPGRVGAQK